MTNFVKRWWLLLLPFLAAVLLATWFLATRGSFAPKTVVMSSATPRQLAYGGIALMPPAGRQPAISRNEAIKIATDAFADIVAMGGVREVALADVEYRNRRQTLRQLSWVIDLTPPGGLPVPGPVGNKPEMDTWFFVFVDAQNGGIILAEGGSD